MDRENDLGKRGDPQNNATAEVASFQVEFGGKSLRVVLIEGDIIQVHTDAIMYPSNHRYGVGRSGVDYAISTSAGEAPFLEAQEIAGQNGVEFGEAHAVTGGDLGVKHIIFVDGNAALHPERRYLRMDDIELCVANSMQAAAEAGDVSLALPLFGTGIMSRLGPGGYGDRPGSVTPEVSVAGILHGIRTYMEKSDPGATLNNVSIVVYPPTGLTQQVRSLMQAGLQKPHA